MFDYDIEKMKKDLLSKPILLPEYDSIEELKEWFCNMRIYRRMKEKMTFENYLKFVDIAKKCHDANNELLKRYNKEPLDEWKSLNREMKFVTLKSVKRIIDNPKTTPEEIHDEWAKNKLRDGWVYGEVKDEEKKTHPLLVDFDKMGKFDQEKDIIFIQTVLDNMVYL